MNSMNTKHTHIGKKKIFFSFFRLIELHTSYHHRDDDDDDSDQGWNSYYYILVVLGDFFFLWLGIFDNEKDRFFFFLEFLKKLAQISDRVIVFSLCESFFPPSSHINTHTHLEIIKSPTHGRSLKKRNISNGTTEFFNLIFYWQYNRFYHSLLWMREWCKDPIYCYIITYP